MGLSYIICTAPRTGSTLLAEALKATGCAGRPAEYFDIHAHNEQYWMHTGARVREATPARQHAAAASPNAENAPLPLIAYSVERGIEISLEPAPSGRDWMDVAPQRFAYRCLPLLLANQAG